jgi:hypothetical protein
MLEKTSLPRIKQVVLSNIIPALCLTFNFDAYTIPTKI